jgi:hypothetical protein
MQEVALTTFKHSWEYCAHGVYMGHDIDIPLVLPDVYWRIQWVPSGCDSGVIEEEINGPKLLFGSSHQVIYLGFYGDVTGNGKAANFLCHLPSAFPVDVSYNDPRAFGCKRAACRCTDAAGTTCNDANLIV